MIADLRGSHQFVNLMKRLIGDNVRSLACSLRDLSPYVLASLAIQTQALPADAKLHISMGIVIAYFI
jgi:hypothetical protein